MSATDHDAVTTADAPDAGTAPARWLSAPEQTAWLAYLRGSRMLENAFDADLAEHGVRLSEYELLHLLSAAEDGRLRMHSLATQAVQSRSRLTHTATRLERRGWVRREAAATDGRGIELTLTSEGLQMLRRLAPVHVASVRRHLVDVLTPQQMQGLGQAMGTVVATQESAGRCDDL